jgi:hypothetical protein
LIFDDHFHYFWFWRFFSNFKNTIFWRLYLTTVWTATTLAKTYPPKTIISCFDFDDFDIWRLRRFWFLTILAIFGFDDYWFWWLLILEILIF